jgi:hypothetical protein
MDQFFLNNANLLPPDQVRLVRVDATPYPDRRRIKLEVELTPFKERPNLEITIRSSSGTTAAAASVLATMHHKMEFVLHLRGMEDPAGDYTVSVVLYYDESQHPQDTHESPLIIPPG